MIRVILERHLKEGKREDLIPLLIDIRMAALRQPGYISGETLTKAEDPSVITVLSTWRSLKEWQTWEKSEARKKIDKQIEPLLREKPRVSIYQIMAAEEKTG